jgi:hypothetical protein
MTLLV